MMPVLCAVVGLQAGAVLAMLVRSALRRFVRARPYDAVAEGSLAKKDR